jgi:hypothetical protein
MKIAGKIKEIRVIINVKNPPIFGVDKQAHLVKHKLYIHTEKKRREIVGINRTITPYMCILL